MRIAAIIPFVLALMNGEAAEVERVPERRLGVCMEKGTDMEVEQRARALATGIFADIGVGIEWSCSGGSPEAITIAISNSTPDKDFPGALAYAQPFADHILVFGDRVHKSVPQMRARLLAYVLAHEIAHVLQGIVRHSESGIMKAHWDHDDIRELFSLDLKFTTYDVLLIHGGMDAHLSQRTRGLLARLN